MTKLIPPDKNQCQAEKPNGVNFMTLGGRAKLIRCTNKPAYLMTEKTKGEDGQIGQMTVCADCLAVFDKQVGRDNVIIESLEPLISKTPQIIALWAVQWEESERGWGCRPDGYSFHRNPEEARKFIKDYEDKLPKHEVPDEYSRTVGDPKLIEVSQELYNHVMEKGSVWLGPNNESAYKTYSFPKVQNG